MSLKENPMHIPRVPPIAPTIATASKITYCSLTVMDSFVKQKMNLAMFWGTWLWLSSSYLELEYLILY